MKQTEINAALAACVDGGGEEAWRTVIEAIRAGTVEVVAHPRSLTIRAIERPAALHLGSRLRELRATSGVLQADIVKALEISPSSLIRLLQGQAVTNWPTMMMMIQFMGGDPEDYRADYQAAKAEQLHRPEPD